MRLSKHSTMQYLHNLTPILDMDPEDMTAASGDDFLDELALRAGFSDDETPHRDPVLDWIN